ncbi:diablo, IAP-binding mitochondrial protein b [Pygocentrus nattereri]|uniref:Direct IAP-binding protein with low pI n=1 Tax=Pygocentrus nattereri TaxID=42514 RepID=A0AAR2IZ64_PYGNA|nr:diablo, IAP-binding mitochondrial protein b [Pygocentrus nattereri]
MALFRRKAFALGCFAASVLSTTNRTRHMLGRLPSLIKRNWISLSVSGGLCAVPFVQDTVSHEALIRRASSLVTDSANTYLSQTTLALVDSLNEYINAVHTLITLHRSYVANINKLNPTQENTIWQMIVSKRQEIIARRNDWKKFETSWLTAVDLSELAMEAAFNAGADQSSAAAQTNLQMAQSQVEQVRQRSRETEKELKNSKAEDSERLQTSLTSATQEEEEIPEAYLRED